MKVFKVAVAAGSSIYTVDGIEHDGRLWLVPQWLKNAQGNEIPAFMIRFDNLQHQKTPGGGSPHDYTLNQPVPEDTLKSGKAAAGLEIVQGPALGPGAPTAGTKH